MTGSCVTRRTSGELFNISGGIQDWVDSRTRQNGGVGFTPSGKQQAGASRSRMGTPARRSERRAGVPILPPQHAEQIAFLLDFGAIVSIFSDQETFDLHLGKTLKSDLCLATQVQAKRNAFLRPRLAVPSPTCSTRSRKAGASWFIAVVKVCAQWPRRRSFAVGPQSVLCCWAEGRRWYSMVSSPGISWT